MLAKILMKYHFMSEVKTAACFFATYADWNFKYPISLHAVNFEVGHTKNWNPATKDFDNYEIAVLTPVEPTGNVTRSVTRTHAEAIRDALQKTNVDVKNGNLDAIFQKYYMISEFAKFVIITGTATRGMEREFKGLLKSQIIGILRLLEQAEIICKARLHTEPEIVSPQQLK